MAERVHTSGTTSNKLEVVVSEAADKLWSIVERAWVGSPFLPEEKRRSQQVGRRERGAPPRAGLLVLVSLHCVPEPIDRLFLLWGSDSVDNRWVVVRSLYYTETKMFCRFIIVCLSVYFFGPGTLFWPRERGKAGGASISLYLRCHSWRDCLVNRHWRTHHPTTHHLWWFTNFFVLRWPHRKPDLNPAVSPAIKHSIPYIATMRFLVGVK